MKEQLEGPSPLDVTLANSNIVMFETAHRMYHENGALLITDVRGDTLAIFASGNWVAAAWRHAKAEVSYYQPKLGAPEK